MATDQQLEAFISDSFASIWDLELLSALLDEPELALSPEALVERMRASDLVVAQGTRALASAGIVLIDAKGWLQFRPIDPQVEQLAREALEFYRRYPARARRLMVARQAPGLNAFADAFRLRKDRL